MVNSSRREKWKSVRSFSARVLTVLFATNTAARVLDIQAMNWVVPFDCPEVANSYSEQTDLPSR